MPNRAQRRWVERELRRLGIHDDGEPVEGFIVGEDLTDEEYAEALWLMPGPTPPGSPPGPEPPDLPKDPAARLERLDELLRTAEERQLERLSKENER